MTLLRRFASRFQWRLSRCCASSSSVSPRELTRSVEERQSTEEDNLGPFTLNNKQTEVVTSEVLRDTFGRSHNYLRISLTERCNLRCKSIRILVWESTV